MDVNPLKEFRTWLNKAEEKLTSAVCNRPDTRVKACQQFATLRGLRDEVDSRRLPDEIYDECDSEEDEDEDEEGPLDRGDLVRRFRNLKVSIGDNVVRLETLCVCWNKLNADMKELTSALSSGGSSKMTVEKLERSIAEIRAMFKERTQIIEDLEQLDFSSDDNHQKISSYYEWNERTLS